MKPPRRVLVLGAGLSGLSAAWDLSRRFRDAGRPLDLKVLEASDRSGGNLVSVRMPGYVIDGGADAWVSAKPHATALCEDLGLGGELIATLERNRKVYIAHRGELLPLPVGLMLGVPSDLGAIRRSPLLSPLAKLRLALDLVLPRGQSLGDESLGGLIERRLGREVVLALTEPVLGGIYGGDPWRLSARSVAPQLVELEQSARSLLLGTRARRRAEGSLRGSGSASMFTSLKGGTGALIAALEGALPEGTLSFDTKARAITRGPEGWWVHTEGGGALPADDVVIALPTHAAARVLSELSPEGSEALRAIAHSSAATVFFAFARAAVGHPLDGTGFVVPKREGREIMAVTWVSSKWPGRAPEGVAMMRVFVGQGGLQRGDDELTELALRELKRFVPLSEKALWTRVFRFVNASPQPEVGHALRVAKIRELLGGLKGIHLTGAGYEGVGIPDCVRLAGIAAERIAQH